MGRHREWQGKGEDARSGMKEMKCRLWVRNVLWGSLGLDLRHIKGPRVKYTDRMSRDGLVKNMGLWGFLNNG